MHVMIHIQNVTSALICAVLVEVGYASVDTASICRHDLSCSHTIPTQIHPNPVTLHLKRILNCAFKTLSINEVVWFFLARELQPLLRPILAAIWPHLHGSLSC